MAKRKDTKAAQAAIDSAQDALAKAEEALGNAPAPEPEPEEPAETCEAGLPDCGAVEFHDIEGVPLCKRCWDELEYEVAQDAPQGEPDSIAEQTYAAIATYDQPELTPGKTVTFTVADALTQLGIDAQFASSHAIHRTMIAVSYHDDGSVAVGGYVVPQERAHKFDRDDAGRMAVAQLRKV